MTKAYEKYKPVIDPWIAKLPSHWTTRQMKWLFAERSQKGFPNEQLLVSSKYSGVIPLAKFGNKTTAATKDFDSLKLVKIGDFVISLRSFQSGIEYAHSQGIISPAYTILIPRDAIYSGYFRHLSKSAVYIKLLTTCVTGIREGQNINYGMLRSHLIPLPDIEEQIQISRYLDWKTSEIMRLIAAKKKQIKLLEEQQRAITFSSVNGLNPTVSKKDSNTPWLGQIPSTWDIVKAKYLFKKEQRPPLTDDKTVTCFRDGTVTLRENRRTTGFTESTQDAGYQHVSAGDLVIHIMDAFAGSIGISDSEGKCTPAYSCCTPKNKKVFSPYYSYLLRKMAYTGYIQSLSRGIRERTSDFRFDIFAALFLPVPSFDEQIAIVRHIESKCFAIDVAIDAIKREIALIQEYKVRLISDVVTGQIDVRHITVPETELVANEVNESEDENKTEEVDDNADS